jgi:hypothetical protein
VESTNTRTLKKILGWSNHGGRDGRKCSKERTEEKYIHNFSGYTAGKIAYGKPKIKRDYNIKMEIGCGFNFLSSMAGSGEHVNQLRVL